jgi:hypothetical protein
VIFGRDAPLAAPPEQPTNTERPNRPPEFGKADDPVVAAGKRRSWGKRLRKWIPRRFPPEQAWPLIDALTTTLTLGRAATPRPVMQMVDRISNLEKRERLRPELAPPPKQPPRRSRRRRPMGRNRATTRHRGGPLGHDQPAARGLACNLGDVLRAGDGWVAAQTSVSTEDEQA